MNNAFSRICNLLLLYQGNTLLQNFDKKPVFRNPRRTMSNFWTQLKAPFLALAPMAGVTDLAFRHMCKRFGADVIYTEFASTNALVHGNSATRNMIRFNPEEQPVVCQIFGNDPRMFAESSKILGDMGFAGVDVNFGCPAYKIVKHGGGVQLMRDLDLCYNLIKALCDASPIPVSIKIRSAINCAPGSCDKNTAVDLVNRIKDLPVSALMIHGRTYEKPFDGEPDVDMITQVKALFPGTVIANGGIYTPEDAQEMLNTTGADGLGIARGSHGKPWIFKQIKDYLSTGAYYEPTWDEKKEYILEHARIAFEHKGERGVIEMRKHLGWYVKGFANAKQIRMLLMKAGSVEDIKSALAQM